ncbi:MAG: PAS domain S-box protein [Halobacteriales archaeon]|nr:PAS domain S-box protein [Halobacteriales archaeon]
MSIAGESIRVLHVDDDPDFVDIASEFLTREDERLIIDTETAPSDALTRLDEVEIDCIISDYDMPSIDGVEFLRRVREDHPDLPFILFTGKGSETVASEAISAGVTDYLQKQGGTDQYTILANRIINVVEKYRTETVLEQTENRYRQLIEQAPIPILIYRQDGEVMRANSAAVECFDADSEADLIGRNGIEFTHPDDRTESAQRIERIQEERVPTPPAQIKARTLKGEVRHVITVSTPIQYDGEPAIQTIAHDITDRITREKRLTALHDVTSELFEATSVEEIAGRGVEAAREILDLQWVICHRYDQQHDRLIPIANTEEFEAQLAETPQPIDPGDAIVWRAFDTGEIEFHTDVRNDPAVMNEGTSFRSQIVFPLGEYGTLTCASPVTDDFTEEDQQLGRILATAITTAIDRIERENALKYQRDQFESLFETFPEPVALVTGDSEETATITRVNSAFEETFGYVEADIVDERLNDLLVPDDRLAEARQIDKQAAAGEFSPQEVRRVTADGEQRDFLLFVTSLTSTAVTNTEEVAGFVVYADITDRRKQADRLAALTEAFPDIAFIIDEEGRHIEQLSSPASEELLVAEPADIIGTRLHDIFPDEQADRFLSAVTETIETGTQQRIEYELSIDGETRYFEARITPYPSEIEQKRAVVWVARELTERKERAQELKRQRDRFEVLFETLPEPTVLLESDDRSRVQEVNSAFEETFGYEAAEIRGHPLNDFIVPEDRTDEANEIDREALSGEVITREVTRRTADGERRDFLLIATSGVIQHEDMTPEGYAIYADITDRKAAERELQRQNERLERFASVISHDLRNPLNVASGHLDLLRAESDTPDDHLDAIERAHARMETLIDDLLLLAKQGELVTEFEPVDLTGAVRESWETVATDTASIRIETDLTIRADDTRLRQVLENLIRNAIEHGGADVTVEVGSLDERPGFYVADTGVGIDPADYERIFESGFTTSSDGIGFGLAIVREVVEAHGWEITVTDSDSGGARFEITGVEPVP